MRATQRIIGCALCIAGFGSAAAASLDPQSAGNVPHAAVSTSSRDRSGSGDVLGLNHDSSTGNSSDGAAGTSSSGNGHTGGTSSAPASPHRPHLGWQSLLPGSIQ